MGEGRERDPVKEAILAGLVGVAAVAIQYAMTSQSFRIDVKARWARIQQAVAAWSDGYRTGLDIGAELFLAEEGPKVITEAEGFLMPGSSIPVDVQGGPDEN